MPVLVAACVLSAGVVPGFGVAAGLAVGDGEAAGFACEGAAAGAEYVGAWLVEHPAMVTTSARAMTKTKTRFLLLITLFMGSPLKELRRIAVQPCAA